MKINKETEEKSIEIRENQIEAFELNAEGIKVETSDSSGFDDLMFIRALHRMAFSFVAYAFEGKESIFKPCFEPVRQYIRRPVKGEKWRIVQNIVTPEVKVSQIRTKFKIKFMNGIELIVCIQIFSNDFYVDLLNTGELHNWGQNQIFDGIVYFK